MAIFGFQLPNGAIGAIRAPLVVLFAVLLLLPALHADFTMNSLQVSIYLNPDGSASVQELMDIAITGNDSIQIYDDTRSTYSDISTWKDRLGLSELRQHITVAEANVYNLTLTPGPVQECNLFTGVCSATFELNYRVAAPKNSTGLLLLDMYKPRTTLYSLNPQALSFEQTKSGDILLPAGTTISITIPQDAENIYFSALPYSLTNGAETDTNTSDFRYDQSTDLNYYVGSDRTFSWKGDVLPNFQFT
jgi:hypothetical protein